MPAVVPSRCPPCWRRPHWARRSWPGWPSARGRTSKTWLPRGPPAHWSNRPAPPPSTVRHASAGVMPAPGPRVRSRSCPGSTSAPRDGAARSARIPGEVRCGCANPPPTLVREPPRRATVDPTGTCRGSRRPMTTGIETRGGADLPGPVPIPGTVPSIALEDGVDPLAAAATLAGRLYVALSGVLLGTPVAVTTAVVAALSGSHLLIEDVPGVGKTVLARALATALGVKLSRVQGHPDLLPSDITGVTVFSPETGTWEFRPGPVFAHVVLLDEMNRTPPRTQSALLEAMEEQQVTVDGESWPLPQPHLVIGTQNPIGQLGTYPLVESQLDRFGLSTSIGYPDADIETRLVLHNGGRYALDMLVPVSDPAQWHRAISATASVHVVTTVAEYAVSLVRATRSAGTVRLGASPRAAISLLRSAQAYAVLAGRAYVTPQDVQAVAVACLSHRLIAEGSGGDGPTMVGRILAAAPVPPT